ncbi:hypothetical protein HNR60_002030 [Rhodopseudomonas rhenobacensis]|uniref:Uncharacterized protein n=1 Tax=Rhodopseudomonas rhenobacensis TaxID=87461 RepID=A0A7W7Z3G8_9BRAD|nr:hypothetical protein [Rhodopseudomonas rhenobacensis]MBB5047276.1 hypothetical protein [Rhodopseudomonas rhenobacensis]
MHSTQSQFSTREARHAAELANANADAPIGAAATAVARANVGAPSPRDQTSDPWQFLVQIGMQVVAALASGNEANAPAHPWIEHDRASGAKSLKIPMPAPKTAIKIANAFSALADSLRANDAHRQNELNDFR